MSDSLRVDTCICSKTEARISCCIALYVTVNVTVVEENKEKKPHIRKTERETNKAKTKKTKRKTKKLRNNHKC